MEILTLKFLISHFLYRKISVFIEPKWICVSAPHCLLCLLFSLVHTLSSNLRFAQNDTLKCLWTTTTIYPPPTANFWWFKPDRVMKSLLAEHFRLKSFFNRCIYCTNKQKARIQFRLATHPQSIENTKLERNSTLLKILIIVVFMHCISFTNNT